MSSTRYDNAQWTASWMTLPPSTRLLATAGGWTSAGELRDGTALRTADGGVVHVRSVIPGRDGPVHRVTLGDGTSVELGAEQVMAVELGRGSQRRRKEVSVGELATWVSAG